MTSPATPFPDASGDRSDHAGQRPYLDRCDRCGTAMGAMPPVDVVLLGPGLLWRCDHCGLRSTLGAVRRAVSTCKRCGLSFAVEHGSEEGRCGDCREGLLPNDLPGQDVAAAAEHEIAEALSDRYRFFRLPGKSDYLTRLARVLAPRIFQGSDLPENTGLPALSSVVVHVFKDDALRTLSLPSGLILVSTGTLGSVRDEAELAFVLGHEVAHLAAGDPSIGLIRIGLRTVSAIAGEDEAQAWSRVAEDLIRLGYGSTQEGAADLAALRALIEAGYDPTAPASYLRRLQRRVQEGNALLADLACAHPPVGERDKRIAEALRIRFSAAGPGRTNRELFRRAAGPVVLSTALVEAPEGLRGAPAEAESSASRLPWVLTTLAIVLLAGLILTLGYLFAG